jgi:hypothetical protein
MHSLYLVIKRTKELESLLQAKYGAVGRGLTQKTFSVEPRLSALVICGLRRVASIRNRLLHDPEFTDEMVPADFDPLCDDLVDALKVESVPKSPVAIAKRSPIERSGVKLPPISRLSSTLPFRRPTQAANVLQPKADASPRIIRLPAPIVVRELVKALGVPTHRVIAELMCFNQFKGVGDTIDESTAADVCYMHGCKFRIANDKHAL